MVDARRPIALVGGFPQEATLAQEIVWGIRTGRAVSSGMGLGDANRPLSDNDIRSGIQAFNAGKAQQYERLSTPKDEQVLISDDEIEALLPQVHAAWWEATS